jgi:uncharacterized protein (TIGR03086 family)
MAQPALPDLLETALEQARNVIAHVRPEQAELPTPCRSWSVSTVIGHVVHDAEQYAAVAAGGQYQFGVASLDAQRWSPAFAEGMQALLSAWRARPALDATDERRINQQIAEFTVHTWDIARATRQDVSFDEEVAGRALAWAKQNLRAEHRGSEESGMSFGPEVAIADDAPAADRLAAFFGRDPGAWS